LDEQLVLFAHRLGDLDSRLFGARLAAAKSLQHIDVFGNETPSLDDEDG
jgi:hypothetical protein